MNEYKRKKKLIDAGLQLRLVGIFFSLACTAALLQVVLLNRALLALSDRLDADVLLQEMPPILTQNFLITLAVLLPLMVYVGVHVTHRIVGPLYRFGKHFDAIAAGEDPGDCRIRTKDEFQELCGKLNAAVHALREQSAETDSPLPAEPADLRADEPRQAA